MANQSFAHLSQRYPRIVEEATRFASYEHLAGMLEGDIPKGKAAYKDSHAMEGADPDIQFYSNPERSTQSCSDKKDSASSAELCRCRAFNVVIR